MWKEIEGYEGYYEISDSGEVKSLDRYVSCSDGTLHHIRGRIMKQSICRYRDNDDVGYLVVNLRKNGTSYVAPIHRLVAKAFIPNPQNLTTVNHIDGNKHNNNVSNLEWASYRDNNIHALLNNLRSPRGNAIRQYTLDGAFVAEYKSTCEAARKTGLSRCGISHCLNGRCDTSGGFIWKKVLESATTISSESTAEDELPSEAQGLSL